MNNFLIRYFGKAWMALTFLFLYLPLMFMIVFSFNSTRQDAQFTGFSLRWYEALTKDTKIVDGFWLSLQVATASGVASAVLATFAAFVLVRYRRFQGRTLFSGMVNAPLVMPEVVIGLSLAAADGGHSKRLWLATAWHVDHCARAYAAGHGLWHGGGAKPPDGNEPCH
jgi:putrescine transport system permease protein